MPCRYLQRLNRRYFLKKILFFHYHLYLLSNTGKILWKKNVKEKFLGDVLQVDYFANNKLQLLFVTENYIHVMDRNGNYLKDFPVKIKYILVEIMGNDPKKTSKLRL